MEIKKWVEYGIIPYEALLLADPNISEIKRYFYQSDVFLIEEEEYTVGVVCIQNKEDCSEIVNIAVLAEYQGLGYGKQLLDYAISHVKQLRSKNLIVKTANSSIQALAFYQKAGFRMVEIVPDYFTTSYSESIWENGILAQDQIILQLSWME
ncbi:GNAT family acetyltransferase [Listeria grandensis FSL F6-0971]|uniref:GNAT family acetyltransferase n=1 Tax=Listeria grandensis FSL F6-0971 TaxID=1265819 RepID=W7B8E0_9LIST|nr:GNAT family N-acetyltransferase [Listeria grandensis]EUJ23544.1 GNAT family acetyltransferase [Listeria grandensis FSL F6-0971]